MRPLLTRPLVVAVAVLGLGACDGVSEDTYAERVGEVCVDIEREVTQLQSTSAETPGEIAAVIDDVIRQSRDALRRVKEIERPDGDAGADADRFVKTLEREVEEVAIPALEALRDAVVRRDQEAAAEAGARLQQLESSESDRLARDLGAEACAG
ncbi:MAG: hypothetical protein ICV69_05435 [Thermoleophilaceae bacterium]|nr:hypothetical protein [Thermoleophilaceae bacterium]